VLGLEKRLVDLWKALDSDDHRKAAALIKHLCSLVEEWEASFVQASFPVLYPPVTPSLLSEVSYESVDPVSVTSGQTVMGDTTRNDPNLGGFMNVSHRSPGFPPELMCEQTLPSITLASFDVSDVADSLALGVPESTGGGLPSCFLCRTRNIPCIQRPCRLCNRQKKACSLVKKTKDKSFQNFTPTNVDGEYEGMFATNLESILLIGIYRGRHHATGRQAHVKRLSKSCGEVRFSRRIH